MSLGSVETRSASTLPQKQLSPGQMTGAETGGEERRVERKASDALRAEHGAAARASLTSRALGVDLLVGVGAAVEEGECCECLHGVGSSRIGVDFRSSCVYRTRGSSVNATPKA
jgi:hypothetical protein